MKAWFGYAPCLTEKRRKSARAGVDMFVYRSNFS